jgi:hypothetical protein
MAFPLSELIQSVWAQPQVRDEVDHQMAQSHNFPVKSVTILDHNSQNFQCLPIKFYGWNDHIVGGSSSKFWLL